MPRVILVVESGEELGQSFAIPFADRKTAFPDYKVEVLKNLRNYYYKIDDPEYLAALSAATEKELGEWSEVLLLNEGDVGVWTGFSSSDRSSIGGPLPLPINCSIGNGDPNFYFTVGVPDGQKVQMTPSATEDETHELYQLWLAAHQMG